MTKWKCDVDEKPKDNNNDKVFTKGLESQTLYFETI